MTQHPQYPQAPPPGRDLPINDPPPSDGSQPPVQDPPLPEPDPASAVRKKYSPNVRPAGPDTAEPAAAIDEGWPDDTNPEAHESPV